MKYEIIDKETYYRRDIFRHYSEDCKCSISMTARIDVSSLVAYSSKAGSSFYINFLYLLCKALNSRAEYRMDYLEKTGELICYDKINPIQYVFHEDTQTYTQVYTEYNADYRTFYGNCVRDIERARHSSEYGLDPDPDGHPNWFEASYIPWCSYDSLNVELPEGNQYFPPIINWGKYRDEGGRLMMPVTARMNQALADGYLVAITFKLIEKEIANFIK